MSSSQLTFIFFRGVAQPPTDVVKWFIAPISGDFGMVYESYYCLTRIHEKKGIVNYQKPGVLKINEAYHPRKCNNLIKIQYAKFLLGISLSNWGIHPSHQRLVFGW